MQAFLLALFKDSIDQLGFQAPVRGAPPFLSLGACGAMSSWFVSFEREVLA